MSGVKEIVELLDGLTLVSETLASAAKDGFHLNDIIKIVDLAKNHKVLVEAIKGLDQVVVEAKDLKVDEISLIAGKVLELVQKVKAQL